MKKLLSILAIFAISFQYVFSQDIEIKNDDREFAETINELPDVRAEFKGGMDSLMSFLSSEIKYPEDAQKMGVQQIIYVNFIVRSDGSVDGLKITRTKKLDEIKETEEYEKCVEALKNEAIRAVKATSEKWIPSIKNGINVHTYFTIPINFVLTDKTSSQDTENKNDTISEKKEVVRKFVDADIKAQFKGGDKALNNFLSENINYPIKAVEWGASQKIVVQFTIFKDGKIGDIEVKENIKLDKTKFEDEKKKAGYQEAVETLKNESIRLVKLTNGKWIPAQKDGENVDAGFILPIQFILR